jgi:hypothetical protein
MAVRAPLIEARDSAERLGLSPDPHDVTHLTPGEAILDFPLAVLSTGNLADVYYGTLESPYFLDRQTRAKRTDGGHVVEDVGFALAVPKNPKPGPMPVVIFGHGLVTERRFVLAVANAMAAKGFATISIDFPFHGARTYCATGGPISVVNPSTGEVQSLNPCKSGTSCNKEGRCVASARPATAGWRRTPGASCGAATAPPKAPGCWRTSTRRGRSASPTRRPRGSSSRVGGG